MNVSFGAHPPTHYRVLNVFEVLPCSYINGRHLKTSLKSKVNLNLNYFIYRNRKSSKISDVMEKENPMS